MQEHSINSYHDIFITAPKIFPSNEKLSSFKGNFPDATFIGDGVSPLSLDELAQSLRNASDNFPDDIFRIFLSIHGIAKDFLHLLDLGGNDGKYMITTEEMLDAIQLHTKRADGKSKAMHIYLASCQSETVFNYFSKLPENSTLTILSGKKDSSIDLNLRQLIRIAKSTFTPWEAFADIMSFYPQDSTIVRSKFYYKVNAIDANKALSDKELSEYFRSKYENYQQTIWQYLDPSMKLPPLKEKTSEELAAYRNDLCFVSLVHKEYEYLTNYLAAGYSPDIKSPYSNTTLFYDACATGDKYPVELLLQYGVKIDIDALANAAEYGRTEIVKLLLQNGLDLRSDENKIGAINAFVLATDIGSTEIAELLLQNGLDLSSKKNEEQLTRAFDFALIKGKTEIVRTFINNGIDPLTWGEKGTWNLIRAVEGNHTKIAQLLLQKGVDPTNSVRNGIVITAIAADYGNTEMVKSLFEHGVNILTTTDKGVEMLAKAADRGNIDLVLLLLKYGVADEENKAIFKAISNSNDAKIFANTYNGREVFIQAAKTGDMNLVLLLLEKGLADKENEGVFAAVSAGQEDIVQFFLKEKKVNPNLANNDGHTLLTNAAMHRQAEVTQLLLNFNADPNIEIMELPLIISLNNNDEETSQVLINAGAYLDLGSNGVTPRELINESQNKEIRSLIDLNGKKIADVKWPGLAMMHNVYSHKYLPGSGGFTESIGLSKNLRGSQVIPEAYSSWTIAAGIGLAAGCIINKSHVNKKAALLTGTIVTTLLIGSGSVEFAPMAIFAAATYASYYVTPHVERYRNHQIQLQKSM